MIEEVGSAVVTLRSGDRVVLPFNIACGVCLNWVRGQYNFLKPQMQPRAAAQ